MCVSKAWMMSVSIWYPRTWASQMVGTCLILASSLIQSKFYLVLIYKMKTKRKDKRLEKYLIWIICLRQVSQPKHKSFWIQILNTMKFYIFPQGIESQENTFGDFRCRKDFKATFLPYTLSQNGKANTNLTVHLFCKEPDLCLSTVRASVGRKCQCRALLEPAGLFGEWESYTKTGGETDECPTPRKPYWKKKYSHAVVWGQWNWGN